MLNQIIKTRMSSQSTSILKPPYSPELGGKCCKWELKKLYKHYELKSERGIEWTRTTIVQEYTLHHLASWKYDTLYVLSAWCVTTNLKAMLTDGFCFPFLLVPQTTLHIGSLCFMANCLLPHLLITGWLLTIYSIAWFIMPFLGLDATHRRKVWLLLKELWTLLSAFL